MKTSKNTSKRFRKWSYPRTKSSITPGEVKTKACDMCTKPYTRRHSFNSPLKKIIKEKEATPVEEQLTYKE